MFIAKKKRKFDSKCESVDWNFSAAGLFSYLLLISYFIPSGEPAIIEDDDSGEAAIEDDHVS